MLAEFQTEGNWAGPAVYLPGAHKEELLRGFSAEIPLDGSGKFAGEGDVVSHGFPAPNTPSPAPASALPTQAVPEQP